MDLSQSIEPRSGQLNADDLISGPRTVTIVDVVAGNPDQPVNVVTQEFGPGRPYKPSKSMRRVIVAIWEKDSAAYIGRRMTLFRNPKIRFGKDEVGGIQISHMSHLDKPRRLALTVSRGKREQFVVEPLPDAPKPPDYAAQIKAATTKGDCNKVWKQAGDNGHLTDDLKAAIIARVGELEAPADDDATLPVDGGEQS